MGTAKADDLCPRIVLTMLIAGGIVIGFLASFISALFGGGAGLVGGGAGASISFTPKHPAAQQARAVPSSQ